VKRLYGYGINAAAPRAVAASGGVLPEGAGAAAASDATTPEAAATVIRLSPSGLERYARCPFAHFVAYGLRPAESRTYEIGPRERGDLLHKVLMGFSKELTTPGVPVTGDGSKWMSVDREGCKMIVDGIFSNLMESPGDRDRAFAGIFKQGKLEEYRTERIKTAAYMAAWMIAEQVKAGIIETMFFEERFGHGRGFPPVTRRMEDGTEIRIEGQIDRIDIINGGRVKIIDYKSGDESFDIEEARQGWRLQLMLYLEAATAPASAAAWASAPAAVAPAAALAALEAATAPALKPAGVFYFRIAEPRLDCGAWEMSGAGVDAERVEKELRKAFRMDGVAVDSQEALRAIAGTEFNGPHFNRGYSDIIAVRAGKDEATGEDVLVKSHPASRKLLDEEEFEQLREDVGQRVHEFCAALADGVIYAEPKSAKEHSACRFCGYKAICCYDPRAAHGGPGGPGSPGGLGGPSSLSISGGLSISDGPGGPGGPGSPSGPGSASGTGIAGSSGSALDGVGGRADSTDISIDIDIK
jgi:ATP-dependent helicase/nuclease subunit B